MTTPANITLQVRVNGGAIQTGAIIVAHTNTIDLSVDNVAGINKYRWELYEYPEGLTLADGETDGLSDADGETLALGETEGLSLAEGETDALGLTAAEIALPTCIVDG